MNTKELGRWRKLWTKPSPSWEMLPAGARGLGDELLRYCDDEGRLPLMGLEPWHAASRIIRAHVSERRWVQSGLERLITDGFVRVESGALVIKNFVTAQAAVTESGERMREKRARDAAEAGERMREKRARDAAEAGERLADDRRATGARRQSDATPRNHETATVTVTASEEISSEKKRLSPLTPHPGGERAEVESTPAEPPEVRCSTVERANLRPGAITRADRDVVAEVLRKESGDRIETRAVPHSWLELLDLCAGAGYSLDDLAAVGRYLAAGVSWVRPKRISIGYLAGGKSPGSILEQLVAEANDRKKHAAVRRARAVDSEPTNAETDDAPAATREQFVGARAMLAKAKAERFTPPRLLAGGADGA